MAVQTEGRTQQAGWLLSISLAFGTYNGAATFGTSLGYELDSPVDSDEHEAIRVHVGSCLQGLMYTPIHLRNFHIRQHAHTPTEPGIYKGEQRGGKYNLRGLRPIPQGAVLMPSTTTVKFPKKVRKGREGFIELRGCVSTDDVEYDDSNSLVLKKHVPTGGGAPIVDPAYTTFGRTLFGDWPHGKLVMLDSALNILDFGRLLYGFGTPELHDRQSRNKRSSVKEAVDNAKIREAREVIKQGEDAVSHLPSFFTDPTYSAKAADITRRLTEIMAELPLKDSLRLTAEQSAKWALAANKAF